jgi:hypothetical protein
MGGNTMHGDRGRRRWIGGFVFVVLMLMAIGVGVGLVSYNIGVSQGLAIGAQAAAPVEQGARVAMPYYGHYGWHPWGFGFGGFGFFVPFLFFAFFFLMLRRLVWGAQWRHHGYGYGYGRGCGDGGGRGRGGWGHGRYDLPPGFEDWHRRAHDRMSGDPAGPAAHL